MDSHRQHQHQHQQQQRQQQQQSLLESLMSLQPTGTIGNRHAGPISIDALTGNHHVFFASLGNGGVATHHPTILTSAHGHPTILHHATDNPHAHFFHHPTDGGGGTNAAAIAHIHPAPPPPPSTIIGTATTAAEEQEHHRQQVAAAIANAHHQQQQQQNLDLLRFRQQEQEYMLAAMRTDMNRYTDTNAPLSSSTMDHLLALRQLQQQQQQQQHPHSIMTTQLPAHHLVQGGGGCDGDGGEDGHDGDSGGGREGGAVQEKSSLKRKRQSKSSSSKKGSTTAITTAATATTNTATTTVTTSTSTARGQRDREFDWIYDKSLKLVQMGYAKEVSSMKPLLEIVSGKRNSIGQKKRFISTSKDGNNDHNHDNHINNDHDGTLAGSFVTNVVENENWIFDLLLNTTLDHFKVETEQKVLDCLRSANNGSSDGRHGQLYVVSMDNLRNVVKVVTQDCHGRIRDAVKKAVALSYVETVNRLDTIDKEKEEMEEEKKAKKVENINMEKGMANQKSSGVDSSPEAALDGLKVEAEKETMKDKYDEKMQAMLREHEAFVANLVEEHEKREELLVNKIEAQRVLHSRMVDNCLVASSKAVKIVRESILSDLV